MAKRNYPFTAQGLFDYAIGRGADPETAARLALRFRERYRTTWREHFAERFATLWRGTVTTVIFFAALITLMLAAKAAYAIAGMWGIAALFAICGAAQRYRTTRLH